MLWMLSISNKNTNDFISLFFFKFYNRLVSYLAINLSHAIHKPIYDSKEIIIVNIAGESKKPIIFIVLIIIFDNLNSLFFLYFLSSLFFSSYLSSLFFSSSLFFLSSLSSLSSLIFSSSLSSLIFSSSLSSFSLFFSSSLSFLFS